MQSSHSKHHHQIHLQSLERAPLGLQLARSPVVSPLFATITKQQGLRMCFIGTVGGIVVLFLVGCGLHSFCKGRGLRIPKIRKASGPMSLFDSQEWRHNPQGEETIAVERPLLYVCATLPPHLKLLTWMRVSRILRTLRRSRRLMPS